MRKLIIGFFLTVPVITVLIFINAAFIQGNVGFKIDKTQKGLLISNLQSSVNPVMEKDLLVSINGLSHHEILGNLILQHPEKSPGTLTVNRDGQILNFPLKTIPFTLFSILSIIWPRLMLMVLFLSLGMLVVYKRPGSQTGFLFFMMLCSFATALSATIPSSISFFSPDVYSFSFLLHAPFNWISFGLWLHFALKFPEERDLIKDRWWIPASIYLVPAVTTIAGAWLAAGGTPEFFGWVQRLRNIYLPFIIIAVFIKHVLDYVKIKNQQVRNQIKLPLIAYWPSFAPYLLLYLLPSLIIDTPLISFRIAVFGFFILPLAYYAGILKYKLFKVDQIISKTIAYMAIITVLSILYSLFFAALKKWVFGDAVLSKELFLIFLILVNIVFHPVILKLDRLIHRLFFKDNRIPIKKMHRLSDTISSTLDLSEIIRIIIRVLPRSINIQSAGLLLIGEDKVQVYPDELKVGLNVNSQNQLLEEFKHSSANHIDVFQTFQDPEFETEIRSIEKNNLVLMLPMRASEGLTGIVFIGPKNNDGLFDEADILMLSSFANQTAIAIENAKRHEILIKNKKQLEQLFNEKIQSEKMAAIGEMTSILAHELKNPLGIIHSSAQYLSKGKQSKNVTHEMLDYILKEVDHINLSINSILHLARQKPPELSKVDIEKEVRRLIAQWERSQDHCHHVNISIDLPFPVSFVYADFRQLAQVLLNLIRNSEEMMTDGGQISICLEQDGNHTIISVMDNGPGIPDEIQDQVFDNFFTTKKQGLGLGLAACRQIIRAHGGNIDLTNRIEPVQTGAVARIRLPIKPLANLDASNIIYVTSPA